MEDMQIRALEQMLSAVNAGDAGRYAKLYCRDAVIRIHGVGQLDGREAIERHEVDLLSQFPGTRLGFHSHWRKGDLAVVHYAVDGRTADGRPMGHEGLLFHRFHPSGLIEEERRYFDSLTPMAQLGMLGGGPVRSTPALPAVMESCVSGDSAEEEANVALVRSSLAASAGGNEAASLAAFAENAVIDELVLPEPFRGRGMVKTWLETWARAAPDAASEIVTILGVGDCVLVETVLRGTLSGPLGRLAASHKPFAAPRAFIARVSGGRIDRLASFMNGKPLA